MTTKQNTEASAGTDPIVEFDAKALAPLSLFIPKNDIRYYLNGIAIFPALNAPGVIIAATDGHRLALWHDPEGKADRPYVFKASAGLIIAAKKRPAKFKTASVKKIRLDYGRLVVTCNIDGEVFVQAGKAEIDGKFPDVFRLVPSNDVLVPGLHGAMNATYLKQLGEAAKMFGASNGYYASARHYTSGTDGSGPIVTRFYGSDNFMVVTMPMRDDRPEGGPVPAAFTRKKEAA